MERYLYWMGYYFDDNWSQYNPSGFQYGNTNFQYVMDYNQSNLNIYFVSEYAKTNGHEDRAELFADLMFRPYQKYYMNINCPINTKAKNMAIILRKYFPNSTGARWERWISW